jgi:hypothetical protein
MSLDPKSLYIYSKYSSMMAVRFPFGYFMLGLMLILSSFGSLKSFGADLSSADFNDSKLEELLAEYQNGKRKMNNSNRI